MKRFHVWALAAALMALPPAPAQSATPPDIHILLDVSHAPDAGEFALKTSPLLMEWYPKIDDILFGADHPLPFNFVVVIFEPHMPVPAETTGNVIHVSADYIKAMPDDFRAMIIHELTHVVQHYPNGVPDSGWLTEGIADYVRHKYFEKDIQPTLHMTAQGQLTGYTNAEPYFKGLQDSGVSLEQKG